MFNLAQQLLIKLVKTIYSSYNEAEVKCVIYYLDLLMGRKLGDKTISGQDIGVITPFATQSKHLQKALKDKNLNDVTVGTVEIFQGQEREVIIVSAVRSKVFRHNNRQHIGFLSNPRRFNVALTRAKGILVVIGNPRALQVDPHWYHFIKFCREHDACRGIDFVLQDRATLFNSEKYRTEAIHQEVSHTIFTERMKILSISEILSVYFVFH